MRLRILYIDRNNRDGNHGNRLRILEELRKDYEVDAVVTLTPQVVDRVRQAETTRPYEAIITHVPPGAIGPDGHPYGESLAIIEDIVRTTDAVVIAFTGAQGVLLLSQFVDFLVKKSTVEEGLVALRAALRRGVGRRARVRSPAPPQLIQRGNHIVVETAVSVRNGIAALVAAAITRECGKFVGEVTLRKLSAEDPDCVVNGRSIMGLMMLGAGEGARVEISVAEMGPESAKLARRLYGIVTSRSCLELQPDRFLAS